MSFVMRRRSALVFVAGTVLSLTIAWAAAQKWDYRQDAAEQRALGTISADSLRGHLSFIASDLMQGRKDGSLGETIASEYIASQFRRAGLKPAGDDGYFQTANRGGQERKVSLRNVIALLPGSDPKLSDTYILLTAHYDGTGPRAAGSNSGWNAANDDGSGTAAVIEIASALSTMTVRPRRSLVFITFFGEEAGGIGSSLYGSKPAFPLEKTLADVNLEQVGRTDSSEGDQTRKASLTGFDYSDLGEVFRRAGEMTGVTVYKHPRNSDAYFERSDNAVFADFGIPSHTLCVAFMFADYHGAGDTWEKINYENMADTCKMIAMALLILAQSDQEPRWDEAEPKAARYLAAWKRMHGK